MRWKELINSLLDALYPPKCAFCRRILEKENGGICGVCRSKLPMIPKEICCRRFGSEPGRTGGRCYSPLYYEPFVRDSFLRYKFYGLASYSVPYSVLMAECIREQAKDFDLITWVPLSRRRLRKRGYDQAELLARGISNVLGLDAVQLLYKNRNNKAQSRTGNAADRSRNVRGVYSLNGSPDLHGKHVLLVDDIITTGATLSECREVLLRSGAAEVSAVTFARAEN